MLWELQNHGTLLSDDVVNIYFFLRRNKAEDSLTQHNIIPIHIIAAQFIQQFNPWKVRDNNETVGR